LALNLDNQRTVTQYRPKFWGGYFLFLEFHT